MLILQKLQLAEKTAWDVRKNRKAFVRVVLNLTDIALSGQNQTVARYINAQENIVYSSAVYVVNFRVNGLLIRFSGSET